MKHTLSKQELKEKQSNNSKSDILTSLSLGLSNLYQDQDNQVESINAKEGGKPNEKEHRT